MLSEGNLIPLPMNPNDGVGDIKNAEVVGKGDTLDQINMVIQTVVNSPEAQKFISARIATIVSELLYDCPAEKSYYLNEYDLEKLIKSLIMKKMPAIEDYLVKVDAELEDVTEYHNILNDKIAELAEQKIPELLNKGIQRVRARNQR